MMNRKVTASFVALVAAFAFAASASASGPDPSEIFIKDLIYGGSGCPQGSADAYVSNDGQSFRLLFDNHFTARVGPNVPISESRKNCQINLSLHVPQGFSFAITRVQTFGVARLTPGASGVVRIAHYFQGQADDSASSRTFDGPFTGPWTARHDIPIAELVWSPCGVERSLNINASVRVEGGHGRSFMAMVAERGRIENIFNISWRTCP